MVSWLLSEFGIWLVTAVAAAAAFVAARLDLRRATRALLWAAGGTFLAGALVWMFRDTYGHYVADKAACLRVSYWGSYREHEMWEEIIDAFEKQYPDIPVKREYITDRYQETIDRLILADDAPDVMLFQDEPFPNFAAKGGFEALDGYCARPGLEIRLERDYWETAVPSFRYQGKTYGIPVWGGECLVIYNRATFREAGVAEPP